MQAWDDNNGVEYRWIHPGYIEGQAAEAQRRGVDYEQSFDDHKFTDLEVPEDILEKATAMVAGDEYDNRIMVTLSLGYDEEHLLMEMAHEADMSLNHFVEHILREDMLRRGVEV
jgi:predicted HicB family RNase H-like nuclease